MALLSDWGWSIVLVCFSLLGVWLYKQCVTRTIEENGRVVTTVRSPIAWTSTLSLASLLHPGTLITPAQHVKPLTEKQRRLLEHLYAFQEIIFGTLIYIVGLLLIGGSLASLFAPSSRVLFTLPLPVVLPGCGMIYWGVKTVVKRNNQNPFKRIESNE